MRHSLLTRALLALLCSLPALAFAHPGHAHLATFSGGLLHPLTGMDHWLAMLAIGVWAQQLGGRSRWLVPTTFVAALLLGASFGVNHVNVGSVELMTALSVLTLGIFIARAQRLSAAACLGVSGIFALCHGYAHGAQLPASGDWPTFVAGFTAMTIALHIAGVGLGMALSTASRQRWVGAAIALAGGAMLVAAT